MKYSALLNGFWEEGYHYYLEFRDKKLTVRGYRREVELETTVEYDARALENGERTVISLADNVLSRTASGEPFTMIRELAYENGELKLLYYYTIMGETLYTLKKVDHGPFDHIIIRDKEYEKRLKGVWEQWAPDGKRGVPVTVKNGRINLFGKDEPFHVISCKTAPERVYIVPADLTQSDFPGCTRFEVLPDMLTSRYIVCDMNMPLNVYARADMLDKISVPEEAKRPPRNTMLPRVDEVCVDEPRADKPGEKE